MTKAKEQEQAPVDEVQPAQPIEYQGIPDDVSTVLPEAGGVAWVELWGTKKDKDGNSHDVKINLTSRGLSALDALTGLLEAMKVASEAYKLNPFQVLQKAPDQPKSEPSSPAPASSAPASPAPGMPVEPQYVPVGGGEPVNGEFIAAKMTVTPRPDGKSKVDFMANGHQYPDVSAVMAPEALAQMLQVVGAWTPDHFRAAQSFAVNYRIQWRNSDRMNRNNKPYKNIVGISLP